MSIDTEPPIVFPAPQQQEEHAQKILVYPQPQQDAATQIPPSEARAPKSPHHKIDTCIAIVGGGPVGMLQALLLSRLHGQECVIIEQWPETTIFPKMEYTNPRSMEIYRQLGLSEKLRKIGVSGKSDLTEVFSTGQGPKGRKVGEYSHDGHFKNLQASKKLNDGSRGPEGALRCTQILVEGLLRDEIATESNIISFFGHRFLDLVESDSGVTLTIMSVTTGQQIEIHSSYVIGCDGAGSLVRHAIGVEAIRRPLGPAVTNYFAHFKSADPELRKFGQYWHINVLGGGVIVDQDEKDTFTCHMVMQDGEHSEEHLADPVKLINDACAGCAGKCDIKVDQILCKGQWKIEVALSDRFRSSQGRIFLAGDSAHQFSPVGGHGLNTGVGDAHDLAWKLSAVLKGWAAPELLASYEAERRSVAATNIGMVEKAMAEFVIGFVTAPERYGVETLSSDTEEGQKARLDLAAELVHGKWVHEQEGMTLGQRYRSSPILCNRPEDPEPEKSVTKYIPTTWPGSRIPHVWLDDGATSTLDLLSPQEYNIIDFTKSGGVAGTFGAVAKSLSIPLKMVHLPDEAVTRKVFGRDAVLVRPDGFSSWQSQLSSSGIDEDIVREILRTVCGRSTVC